jgi:four helix bundle protein
MAQFALDTLRVYALAEEVADAVWEVVGEWDEFAKRTVGAQLVRAADSIGANLSEGYGRATPADNRRFIRIARGSLYETRHFLRRADKRGLIAKPDRARLKPLLKELLPVLNAYLRSVGAAHA